MKLAYHKLTSQASDLILATEHSACFDICACFYGGNRCQVEYYNEQNVKSVSYALPDDSVSNGEKPVLYLPPGCRAKVPTGIILDIPEGFSVRIHARSGNALKRGLVLVNAEGIIDSDYVDELYVLLHNMSNVSVPIEHGERIVQGELVPNLSVTISTINFPPSQKTSRNGGFGSTGV